MPEAGGRRVLVGACAMGNCKGTLTGAFCGMSFSKCCSMTELNSQPALRLAIQRCSLRLLWAAVLSGNVCGPTAVWGHIVMLWVGVSHTSCQVGSGQMGELTHSFSDEASLHTHAQAWASASACRA